MRVPTFSSYTFQDTKKVLGGHPEPPGKGLCPLQPYSICKEQRPLHPLNCVAQLVTDQTAHYLGKEPGPGQTVIDFDAAENLFASVGKRLEIAPAAGYAASQNFVVD